MDNQTAIHILLGERRGQTDIGGLRSYNVFNNKHNQLEGRNPINGLLELNEDYLNAESAMQLDISEPAGLVLVPIAGGLEIFARGAKSQQYIFPGETAILGCTPRASVTVTNPYPQQTVQFLQFRLPYPFIQDATTQNRTFDPALRNHCQPLFNCPDIPARGFIALMDLRSDATYVCSRPSATVIVYAVQGAFECQNRLLHPKDALVLQGLDNPLEFEALSGEAILILVETDND